MARTRQGRGGPRTPNKPAPVSGPGALSRRTDGGPGQPIRSFPAEFQGQRQQLAGQQAAAPLKRAGSPTNVPGGGARPQPPQPLSVFQPSARPNEANTAGIPFGPGAGAASSANNDILLTLQGIGAAFPSEAITRLMRYVQRDRQVRGV